MVLLAPTRTARLALAAHSLLSNNVLAASELPPPEWGPNAQATATLPVWSWLYGDSSVDQEIFYATDRPGASIGHAFGVTDVGKPSQRMLLFGGGRVRASSTILTDPNNRLWLATPDFPAIRGTCKQISFANFHPVVSRRGDLCLCNGEIHTYNYSTKGVETTWTMPPARYHMAYTTFQSRLFVYGGRCALFVSFAAGAVSMDWSYVKFSRL